MITVHCSKALFAKLPLKETNTLRSPSENEHLHSPLGEWTAHLVTLKRKNCVIFVHNQTIFTLVATCLKKQDFKNLDDIFADLLLNVLMQVGASRQQTEKAMQWVQTLVFDATTDRSTMGCINDIKRHMNYFVEDGNKIEMLPEYSFSLQMCRMPWFATRPKSIFPIEEMLKLLDT